MKNPTDLSRDQLVNECFDLFDEVEFWKARALEDSSIAENAYTLFCQDIESMQEEMDFDNTGMIHG
jgi:hypothetical protein